MVTEVSPLKSGGRWELTNSKKIDDSVLIFFPSVIKNMYKYRVINLSTTYAGSYRGRPKEKKEGKRG